MTPLFERYKRWAAPAIAGLLLAALGWAALLGGGIAL